MQNQIFTVEQSDRLDSFLSTKLQTSRNQIAQLIKKSFVTVNGKITPKAGLKLKVDDTIEVSFPEAESSEALEVDFDVDIIFEDDDILVINKPSGVTVHPAPSVKEATLVEWLKLKNISLSTISGEERHGIVHRLDKGTSGAMVIAKTNEAHEKLSEQLVDRTMGRFYIALIDQALKDNLVIDRAIYRNQNNRLKMATSTHDKAKESKTAFAKLKMTENEDHELIACKLFSGRTHQIRVHLESISRRIVGDHLYGFKSKKDIIERIFLHAYILYLTHPVSGEKIEFIAPLPEDLQKVLHDIYTPDEQKEIFEELLKSDAIRNTFSDVDNWLYFATKNESPFG
jgi:23S rRNA pseudouridine1911/1915/1917 synthase